MGPECDCLPDWDGPDCYTYIGPCDCLCDASYDPVCDGPSTKECYMCIENTYRNSDGECACLDDWISKDCDIYRGECDPCCLTCFGPTAYDCIDPQINAEIDSNGHCGCMDGYQGDRCDRYNGQCACCCDGCFGPSEFDCLKTAAHAYRSEG